MSGTTAGLVTPEMIRAGAKAIEAGEGNATDSEKAAEAWMAMESVRPSDITDAMRRAGAEVLWSSFNDVMPYGSSLAVAIAESVYLAMEKAKHSDSDSD